MSPISFGELFRQLQTAPNWARFFFYWLLKLIFVCLVINLSSVLVNYLYQFEVVAARSILLPGFPPGHLANWTDVGLLLAARGSVGLLLTTFIYWALRLLDAEYFFGLIGACNLSDVPGYRRDWRQDLALSCATVLLFRACSDVLLYVAAYGIGG